MVAEYWSGSFGETPSNSDEREIPRTSGALIFIADDSEADRLILTRAFAASGIKNPIRVFEGGAELIRYLKGEGKYWDRMMYPMPRIVFIDLQMPTPNGFEVLQWKQRQAGLPRILWVAMSGSNSVTTINDAYNAGATTFLTKPLDAADIRNLVGAFEDYWFKGGL